VKAALRNTAVSCAPTVRLKRRTARPRNQRSRDGAAQAGAGELEIEVDHGADDPANRDGGRHRAARGHAIEGGSRRAAETVEEPHGTPVSAEHGTVRPEQRRRDATGTTGPTAPSRRTTDTCTTKLGRRTRGPHGLCVSTDECTRSRQREVAASVAPRASTKGGRPLPASRPARYPTGPARQRRSDALVIPGLGRRPVSGRSPRETAGPRQEWSIGYVLSQSVFGPVLPDIGSSYPSLARPKTT